MNEKNREKKTKAKFIKPITASVMQEMGRPRMAKSAFMGVDKQVRTWDRKPEQREISIITIKSGMPREMIWVKRIEGWGCSYCAWTFSSSGSPLGNTIDEMMENFVAKRDKEFVSHVCAMHPRAQPSPKN
jgi:hypothetical protein